MEEKEDSSVKQKRQNSQSSYNNLPYHKSNNNSVNSLNKEKNHFLNN